MSEEKLPFIEEIAELISTKMEQGEMDNDLEYVLTCLKEKIKENLDIDYEAEEISSDSETDDEGLIKEKVIVNKTDEGFYEIKDLELEGCDRLGRKKRSKK